MSWTEANMDKDKKQTTAQLSTVIGFLPYERHYAFSFSLSLWVFAVLGFRRRLRSSLSTAQHGFCRKDKDPQRSIQVPNVLKCNFKGTRGSRDCCVLHKCTETHQRVTWLWVFSHSWGVQMVCSLMCQWWRLSREKRYERFLVGCSTSLFD